MRLLLLAALVTVAFAGCVDDAPVDDAVVPVPDVELRGIVQTVNFNPIEGAEVTVTGPSVVYSDGSATEDLVDYTATTDANGSFALEAPPGNHGLLIERDGFRALQSTVTLPQRNVTFQLQPVNVDVPFNEAFDFDGRIECAAEYLIITPSCDTLLTFASEDAAVFEDESVFDLTTPRGWQTVVLDVRFDGAQHPTIAGLRTSAYAADADAEVFSYQRIHQQWAPGDFSLRIDAGEDYGDAVAAPDSKGGDGLRFEFYPHGHGDDTACVPDGTGLPEEGTCFLGVGVTQDLTFTATATIFVHEPAPQGWTTLAAN